MTTESRGAALLAAYHEREQDVPDRRRLEKIARNFQENARLEHILAMPDDKREALLASSSTLRLSLGGYQQMKAAHEQLKEGTR